MTRYIASLRSDVYSKDIAAVEDDVEIPITAGEEFMRTMARKIADTGSEVVKIDSDSVLWYAWVKVLDTELMLTLGLDPANGLWVVSCEDQRGLLARLFRKIDLKPLYTLAMTIHDILRSDPAVSDIRWYDGYPDGPYTTDPTEQIR